MSTTGNDPHADDHDEHSPSANQDCPVCGGACIHSPSDPPPFLSPEGAAAMPAVGERTDSAFLVEPGWIAMEYVANIGGPGFRVLFYSDGTARFEHKCKVVDGTQIICAPALQLNNGHRIVVHHPLTVEPSIACPDCGTHGFIREGRWVAA